MSKDNVIFDVLFRGKIDGPEIVLCAVMALIGFIMAIILIRRERKVDML